MSNSINTNLSAMNALQGLNRTNDALGIVQKRVNTGFKVADANDDGATFAIAQSIRGNLNAYEAVGDQLSRAKGILTVAMGGAQSVSETLTKMESVLIKLADSSVTGDTRTQYSNDFTALLADLTSYITNASFNGQNNLIQSGATNVSVVSNISGGQITITARDLQATVISSIGTTPANAAAAQNLLTSSFVTAKTAVGSALAGFAADNRRIDNQIRFMRTLSDAAEIGLGAMVDADLAKESAKLQSLQIRQQLATQSLGIANQSPSILLSLFR